MKSVMHLIPATFIFATLIMSDTSHADVPQLSPEEVEVDIDRYGMDLASGIPLDFLRADPHVCRDYCTRHPGCSAWTFVKAGIQGPTAMCYLKSGVPAPVSNTCCVSGIYNKLSAEISVDRPGMDYNSFSMPTPSAESCRGACSADNACVAYTFVHPGVQGPTAMCYLKSGVPAPVSNTCCISGSYIAVSTERDTDRLGMDYMAFDLTLAEPDLCRQACAKDGTSPGVRLAPPAPPFVGGSQGPCKAYTYVNPGVHGNLARCYLKRGIPAAVTPRQCCISGVARTVSFPTPDIGPACPSLYTVVGSIGGTDPPYPQVLSSNEFLKSVTRLKAAEPATLSFNIAVYVPEDPEDAWLFQVEQSVQPTLSSDEVLIVLDNLRESGETKISAYDGTACTFGSSISAPEGRTASMIFNRASASTLVLSRHVCGFLCLSRWWKNIAVWSEPNFWTVFGGRKITITWRPPGS